MAAEFSHLPVELKLVVCAYLSPCDVLSLEQVSKELQLMCQDELVWKSVLGRIKWNAFHSAHPRSKSGLWDRMVNMASNLEENFQKLNNSPSETAVVKPHLWKHIYLQQQMENKRKKDAPSGDASPTLVARLRGLQWKIQSKLPAAVQPKLKISMLGTAMDRMAKDLLYSMMWNKNAPFQMLGLSPGTGGMGGGVSFSTNEHVVDLAALHYAESFLYTPEWRSHWISSDGVIYVTDVRDIELAKGGILPFIGEHSVISEDVPLLVLVCCAGASGLDHVDPYEISLALGLDKLDPRKRWCVRAFNIDTLDGVWEGITWIAS